MHAPVLRAGEFVQSGQGIGVIEGKLISRSGQSFYPVLHIADWQHQSCELINQCIRAGMAINVTITGDGFSTVRGDGQVQDGLSQKCSQAQLAFFRGVFPGKAQILSAFRGDISQLSWIAGNPVVPPEAFGETATEH